MEEFTLLIDRPVFPSEGHGHRVLFRWNSKLLLKDLGDIGGPETVHSKLVIGDRKNKEGLIGESRSIWYFLICGAVNLLLKPRHNI